MPFPSVTSAPFLTFDSYLRTIISISPNNYHRDYHPRTIAPSVRNKIQTYQFVPKHWGISRNAQLRRCLLCISRVSFCSETLGISQNEPIPWVLSFSVLLTHPNAGQPPPSWDIVAIMEIKLLAKHGDVVRPHSSWMS